MTRALLCPLLVLLAACSGTSGDTDRLLADLREARAEASRAQVRIETMGRELREPVPPPEPPGRYADLWDGGPARRGAFLALPQLGVLRWTCTRSYFRIVYAPSREPTHVSYHTPIGGVAKDARIGVPVGATVHSGETVTWVITQRDPPAYVRTRVDVTPKRTKDGDCVLAEVELKQIGRR